MKLANEALAESEELFKHQKEKLVKENVLGRESLEEHNLHMWPG